MIRLGVDTEKDFARSSADYRRISAEKNVYDDESSTEEWTGGKSDVSGKLCLYIEFRR
jgi:hypothetical protein